MKISEQCNTTVLYNIVRPSTSAKVKNGGGVGLGDHSENVLKALNIELHGTCLTWIVYRMLVKMHFNI